MRVFPNRNALQFLSNNVQLSLFNNVLKYQCSSVPKYQKSKKLNSAQAFLEKCVNQFHNRNVELSPSKYITIFSDNYAFNIQICLHNWYEIPFLPSANPIIMLCFKMVGLVMETSTYHKQLLLLIWKQSQQFCFSFWSTVNISMYLIILLIICFLQGNL